MVDIAPHLKFGGIEVSAKKGKDYLYSNTVSSNGHKYAILFLCILHFSKVKENLLDMSGSVLALTVYDHDYLSRDDFIGMVVIDGAEIPRLPGSISDIDDPNAPQRKTYELPLVVDTMTPALRELAERNHQYVNDFNLYYSRGSSVAGNVVSTVTGSLARAFTVKH